MNSDAGEEASPPPPNILLGTIQSRASFRLCLLGGGEIGFVLFIYPQSTRELRALICISKGGGTGEVEEFDRGSQIGKSSKYCAWSWFIVNVSVYSCETNQSRRGRPTKRKQYAKSDKDIHIYIYMYTYI